MKVGLTHSHYINSQLNVLITCHEIGKCVKKKFIKLIKVAEGRSRVKKVGLA